MEIEFSALDHMLAFVKVRGRGQARADTEKTYLFVTVMAILARQ